jgi:phosphatidylinositol alpha-1,6-mannosyltransferase
MREQIHILLVTWNFPPKFGGMEILLSQLANQLCDHSELDIIGPFAPKDYVETTRAKIYRPVRDGLFFFILYSFIQGVTLSINRKYDVIYGGSALISPVVYLLGLTCRIPTAIYVHGLDLIYQNPIYQLIIKFFLPRCNKIISNSSKTKDISIERGVSPERTAIVKPGLDISEFEVINRTNTIKQKYNLNNKKILLSVGRLAERKGILEFVKYSFPEVLKSIPSSHYVIVGDNPTSSLTHKKDIKSLIEAEIKRQGIENNVSLLGWLKRNELIHLYFACDIFILSAINMPGDIEGFGIVLLEAAAAGKPAIASNIGGMADAIDDGKSGYLIDTGSWGLFTNRITHLFKNDDICQQLGQFAKRRILNQFTWDKIILKHLHHLRSIMVDVK